MCTWKDIIKTDFYRNNFGGLGLGLFGSGYRAMMVIYEHKMILRYWYQIKQTFMYCHCDVSDYSDH
jgi:hypothetical protein